MPSSDDIDMQRDLLRAHRRTLAELLKQQAMLGVAYTPPGVLHGIGNARDAIRRSKETLRGWGADVEDLPDDLPVEEQVPASPSAQAGAGLEALADLMRFNEARVAVGMYQASFDNANEQITVLGGYKKLHDLFQQLEDRHAILARAARTLHLDPSAWDDIENHEPELYVIIDEVLAFASQPPFAAETAIWTPRFARAQRDMRAALETADAEGLKNALAKIKDVLDRQISRINTRLVGAADALRLEHLVASLRTLCDRLGGIGLRGGAARLQAFGAGVDALAQLDARLTRSVAIHTAFQEFDDELRRVEVLVASDLGELIDGWIELGPLTQVVCADTSYSWAATLATLADELVRAFGTTEPAKIRRAFVRYRSHATLSFNRVDFDLRDLCQELQRIGAPLDSVLRAMDWATSGQSVKS